VEWPNGVTAGEVGRLSSVMGWVVGWWTAKGAPGKLGAQDLSKFSGSHKEAQGTMGDERQNVSQPNLAHRDVVPATPARRPEYRVPWIS
jgi:hypothetical protein